MKIGEIVGPGFVYQTESTILRVAVRTQHADDAFQRARRRARQWLQGVCSRHDLDVALTEDTSASNGACSVDAVSRPELMVAALRHVDERVPERTWYTNIELRAEENGDRAVCDLRLRAEHPSNARPIDPHPARLVGILCDDPGLFDVEPMAAGAPVLQARDVRRLGQLIDAPERRLPVILASRPRALEVHRVAREMAGLAHVFELDEETSWEISRRYDRQHSVYLGAVKIYPPGVTFASDATAAPLFLEATLQMLVREGKAESTLRRGVLADLTAFFESEPLLTPSSLRTQEAARRPPPPDVTSAPAKEAPPEPAVSVSDEELLRARREAADARQEAEGYWREVVELNARVEELERASGERRQSELGVSVEELSPSHRGLLRAAFDTVIQVRDALLENDRLHDELEQLRSDYEGIRARLARAYEGDAAPSVAPAEPIPHPAWDDFDALEAWANAQYGGTLVLHPRVRDRLRDGNPQDVDALFDILDILGTDYAAMKRGAAGARERYLERAKRFKTGKALTVVGAGLVGDEYECTFEGVRYAAEDHQHIRERGRNFTGRTVCVYFVYDDANDRVIVTSMPRHLETAN
ncbi:MAG TPA: hypothetical protein VKR56_15330 [Candidatus Cybelea sp.]|nr:hypothetical protein [Candidatus Cybelea sp.]